MKLLSQTLVWALTGIEIFLGTATVLYILTEAFKGL